MSVTDNWASRNDTRESAHRIGMEIETSVAHDNLQDYRVAMNHATEYMRAHPGQRDVFKYEVEAQLGRHGATNAVVDFELIHSDTGNNSTITRDQIAAAKFNPSTNAIQRDLLEAAKQNYDQLPPWFLSLSISNASRSRIESRLHTEQESLLPNTQIRNFFDKNDQDISLYDRVKDVDGNIRYGAIEELRNSITDPAQRSALDFIDQQQSNRYYLFGSRGMTQTDLASFVRQHNMNLNELTGRSTPPADVQTP